MKIIAIVVLCTIVISIAVYMAATILIHESYSAIEKEEVVRGLQQVDDAFQSEIDGVWLNIKDWGFWDELYTYALDPESESEFTTTNFSDYGLTNINTSIVLFIDLSGKIQFKKVIDLETGTEMVDSKAPEHLFELEKRILMAANADENSVTRGIVLLPEGPVLFASVPILRTDHTGPSAGTLVFGRFIDKDTVRRVGEITHLSLEAFPYDTVTQPADVVAIKKEIPQVARYVVRPLSGDSIGGYSALYDLDSKPVLILRTSAPREVFKQGESALLWFTIFTSIALLAFSAVTAVLLEKYVIARLTRFSNRVHEIGETHDVSARLEERDTDEVGMLALAINTMLSDLTAARQKELNFAQSEKEASEKLKERTSEIEKMNEIMVGREQKMLEMKALALELKKKLGES